MSLPSLKIKNFTLRVPVFQGGMGLGISWDQLAGNVSKNGALGIISSVGTGFYENLAHVDKEFNGKPYGSQNFYSTRGLNAVITNARKICGTAPLGVNIMHASNEYERIVKDACDAGFDAIISGAGLPTNLPEFASADIALIPIVSSAKALKIICKRWQQRYGRLPDAVVLEGPLSGGHQGFTYEQCTDAAYQLEALIPQVLAERDLWGDFPIIAAGGVWDHADICRMLELGASGVQMGTRFIGTHECDAARDFKQVLIDAKREDIELLKSPVGYPARGIRTNLQRMIEEGTAPKISCVANCVAPCQRGIGAKKVGFCIAERLYDAYCGRRESGLFFTGANGWRLDGLLSVRELIARLEFGEESAEAKAAAADASADGDGAAATGAANSGEKSE